MWHEAGGTDCRQRRQKTGYHHHDQMHLADDYKPLVVGYHNGQAVRLSDVADVENGRADIRASGYMDGIPSITVIIFASRAPHHWRPTIEFKQNWPSVQASIPARH